MARTIAMITICLLPLGLLAQSELKVKKNHGGMFSMGMRTTVSTFNHGSWGELGTGVGGQFRLQFHEKVNTEWFADWMNTDLSGVGHRQDAHIGWSVMYYPLKQTGFKQLMKPYIVMGHCFDYTKVAENRNEANSMERWSAAIQAGIGNHFNLTEHFDITLKAQYMFHLGDHVEAHVNNDVFEIHEYGGFSLEGHLLFTVSLNYKIADLW
ncbi:MAG: hypothetical protein K9J06_04810 [Flavobacteriales bacterium]|nr:hypothetical protein [Flavobacteriales bacterium]